LSVIVWNGGKRENERGLGGERSGQMGKKRLKKEISEGRRAVPKD